MTEPLLAVEDVNGYYGSAHVLQGVSFEMGAEPVALIGRNGMGKSTLCAAIVGLLRSASGSVRLEGAELMGKPAYKVAGAGIGYVPQGRRLFESLTVDEHFEIVGASSKAEWTPARVYDLFPRLAERKSVSGTSLSGGEQQMLAISRALLTNPKLLVMDEPSEGLAPVIVTQVEEMLVRLADEGEMAVLVIEQNIGVACAVSENVAIMVNGRINRVIEAPRLAADRALQQRLLGVGRHGIDDTIVAEPAAAEGVEAARSFPAASSRCSRSRVRCSPIRACW